MGHASHPGRARSLPGARRVGDDGAPHPARGRPGHGDRGRASAREATAALRAGGAQPALAERHLHVRAAAPPARVPGRLHGRLLAVPRVVGDGAPPKRQSGDRGARAGHCRVRAAAGGADGSGTAVRRVAWRDGVSGAAPALRHRAQQEPTAAPRDTREDRALLEDAVGGVSAQDGVRGLRGLPAATGALRPALQLPATASRHRECGAGGSVLSCRTARARGDRSAGARERIANGAGEAAAEALLSGGSARRPRPQHRCGGRSAPRAGRRCIANHPHDQGDRR